MSSLAQLEQSDLFRSVPLEILQELLHRAQRVPCRRGRLVYRQGDPGDALYYVLSGQLASYRITAAHKREYLEFYEAGDCFGEIEVLHGGLERASNVEGFAAGNLLRIDAETFFWLWEAAPHWAAQISRLVQERRAQMETPGEIELVSERRHPYVLVESFLLPVLVALVVFLGLFAATWRHLLPSAILLPSLSVFGIGFALWFLWTYEDWRNDTFILTNRRVVHIEQVPLSSGKRGEALVGQIRGVKTDTPTLGRLFGFKTLIIQTGTTLDTIEFIGLANADEISRRIIDTRDAVQAETSFREKQQNLRAHLQQVASPDTAQNGMESADAPLDDDGQRAQRMPTESSRTWQRLLLYFVPRMRRVDGNTIIWQRHWYILIRLIIFPVLFNLLLILLLVWVALGGPLPLDLQGVWVMRVLFLGWLVALVWLFWRYEDWHNDYYVLNNSEIVDRNSLPLGFKEKTQVFSLDSVQNVRSDVPSIASRLLVMGHVYIDTIGGTEPVKFDSVYNPLEIQRQVMQRVGDVRQRERQQRAVELGEWFAAYQTLLDEGEFATGEVES